MKYGHSGGTSVNARSLPAFDYITHNCVDDLQVSLYGPDGTRVYLFGAVGGDGDNFMGTILDDEAAVSITEGTDPFTGSFRPEGDLRALDGKDAQGIWTLEVYDRWRGDRGTLNSWSIEISTYVPEPNLPPVAVDDADTTNEDTAAIIDVLANDSDGDGNPINITSVADPANGSAVDNGDGKITYTPNPDFNGQDSFTYTIDDGKGGTDTATVTVTVNPIADPPEAVDDTETTEEDTAIDVLVLDNDYDGDNDTLTITAVTQPTSGTVTNHGTYVTFTPAATDTYTFDYTISDGNGGTDTASVTVTVSPAVTALYVYDISFESQRSNRDWQAVFEIRSDSNGDGQGDAEDQVAAGVTLTVEFAGKTYTGTNDSDGIFRTDWIRNLKGGDYYANAVDLVLANYFWDPLALMDLENDSDEDGYPDELLSL
jgi:subtilisin-like proprotein convertase family protein